MKTIRKYRNEMEAGFARSLLASAGIDAIVADANVNTLGPMPRGVRLQVDEQDEARALEILDGKDEGFAPLPDDFVPPPGAVADGDEPGVPPPLEGYGRLMEMMPKALCVLAGMMVVVALCMIWSYRGGKQQKPEEPAKAVPETGEALVAKLIAQGDSAEQKGDYETAVGSYDSALRENPKSYEAYYHRGLAGSHRSEFEKAVADFSEAIGLNPGLAGGYRERGIAYYKAGKLPEALDDFNKTLALDSHDAEAYSQRGQLYGDAGDMDRALDDFYDSIRLAPDNPDTYLNRSIIYSRMGNFDKALEDSNASIRLNPVSAAAYNTRALIYFSKKDYDKALADLNNATVINPGDVMAYNNRGMINSKRGDAVKTIADYQRVLQLAPRQPEGFNNLAWVYATWPGPGVRDGAKAVELAMKACELSEWKVGPFIETLAAAEAEAGDFDAAVKYQEKALGMAMDQKASPKMVHDIANVLAAFRGKKPFRDKTLNAQ